MIGRTWSPLRGWIDGGMAGAIPRPDQRTHTLTVYTHVSAVHDALGTAGSGQAVAVLVAGGIVRWQAAGPPDGERIAELRSALDGLIPHRGSGPPATARHDENARSSYPCVWVPPTVRGT